MTLRMVTTNETYLILKSNVMTLVATFVVLTVFKLSDDYSRFIIIFFALLNSLMPIIIYFVKRSVMRYGFMRKDAFVLCDDEGLENVQNWFKEDNAFGFDLEAIINISRLSKDEVMEKIALCINDERFDISIIDIGGQSIYKTYFYIDRIQHHVKKIIVLPQLSKLHMLNGEFINSINHKGMAFFIKNNLLNPVDILVKKVFDVLFSLLFIVCFLPFFAFLYILVYVDTKGSPLFKQKRIGKEGKEFYIYKFRTMIINADEVLQKLLEIDSAAREEWEKDFKLKEDPRITRLGNILRKTSLDELPQIINVLQGEMSFVGPRPIITDEIKKYGDYFEYFKSVKPGITGLWQVSGRNDISYDERVQLDLWYVRNWSVELDVMILIKTIAVVLFRKGSY